MTKYKLLIFFDSELYKHGLQKHESVGVEHQINIIQHESSL